MSADWGALMVLVLLMGARHGLDADHLATVDALTRHHAAQRASWASRCGLLFSFGHGAVVMGVALVVGMGQGSWQPAAWVQSLGVSISISMLTLLGLLNLWSVWRTPALEVVRPVGIRPGWLTRPRAGRCQPLGVVAIGALFAVSLDTLGQAALFAVAAGRFGSAAHALALGGLFMLGMLLVDGANGLWLARLLARADARARRVSRWLGVTVGVLALAVAALGAARLAWPAADAWAEQQALALGAALLATVALAWLASGPLRSALARAGR